MRPKPGLNPKSKIQYPKLFQYPFICEGGIGALYGARIVTAPVRVRVYVRLSIEPGYGLKEAVTVI